MSEPLTTALYVASLVLALVVAVYVVRDRRPDKVLLGALGVAELMLLAQAVIGIVALVGDDGHVSAITFVGYLLGTLLVLPAAAFWAVGEPSRAGTGVLLVALVVLPVLVLRISQIWEAGHA